MRCYCAPMEGLTTRVYREVHHRLFPGADKYYTPFLAVTADYTFREHEKREILPERNQGIALVPQLLTKSAEDFLTAAAELFDMGFAEVNLNLGCPSGTVTAKGKGGGLLREREVLERLLDGIFAAAPGPVSVKTRLGFESTDEFSALMELYSRYPISELTVHARTTKEKYKPSAHPDVYLRETESYARPLCYNGDLFTVNEIKSAETHPRTGAVMLGRGLIANPALIREYRGGERASREELRRYHDELLIGYHEDMGSLWNAALHMKEHWMGLIQNFEDESGRCARRVARAKNTGEYLEAVRWIFETLPLRERNG